MPTIPKDEADIQAMIQAKELPGVRLTPEYINLLHASLQVETVRLGHSTTVVAAAYLPDGALVTTAYSKPADSASFDLEVGIESARRTVLAAAREKLWELEGYRLSRAVAVLAPGWRLESTAATESGSQPRHAAA